MAKQEKGVVIIAVLWICALLMWFSLQISSDIRLQGNSDINYIRRSQALFMGVGGVNEALARMGQPIPLDLDSHREADQDWQPDGTARLVTYKTGQAIVVIEKETLKVNVNQADHSHLQAVLEKAGLETDEADVLADNIGDFIDPDELPRLKGAEKDRYKQLGLGYGPFDGPLVSIDQLLLVPGITPQLFYAGRASANLDEQAPPENAEIPPQAPDAIGKHSLVELLTVYGNNVELPKEDDLDQEPTVPAPPKGWEANGIYRILSYGQSNTGPPAVVIMLIVRYEPQSEHGYEILFRKIL
jgi:hypothetical protein